MKRCSILGLILFTLQILDALLTYIGIINFGIEIEGNPIVRRSIELFGLELGLISIKLLCIIPIYILIKNRAKDLLLFLIGVYTGIVIIWASSLYKTLI